MASSRLYPVIMAGGSGTRLWPVSRAARPKHLLPLLGERSLLEETARRLAGVAPPADTFVVTSAAYEAEVRRQLPQVPADQIVAEPEGLGTAPAVALAAAMVMARDPDGVVACCPADHVIRPLDAFRYAMIRAQEAAEAGYVVVLGVPPDRADTGYGYVQPGLPVADLKDTWRVDSFHEKPASDVAQEYVASGCLWNAGLFVWSVTTLQEEFTRYLPRLGAQIQELSAAAAAGSLNEALQTVWPAVTDRTTVDFGILERSDRVVCVRTGFSWSDVGSWDALGALLDTDAHGNAATGRVLALDSVNNVLFSGANRLIATFGIEDVVVVDAGDVVLVCPRARAQDLKALVAKLKGSGYADLT